MSMLERGERVAQILAVSSAAVRVARSLTGRLQRGIELSTVEVGELAEAWLLVADAFTSAAAECADELEERRKAVRS